MKILLLGEFSALHKNLKEGLVELGHDVTTASTGDGWKKIESDIDLGSSFKDVTGNIHKAFNIIKSIPKFKGYDVVQLISPAPFPKLIGINKLIVTFILKYNKKVFLVGAGCNDSVTADFLENSFKHPNLYQEIQKGYKVLWIQKSQGRRYSQWLLGKINGFIPIMYEYAQGYRDIKYSKLCPTIPIPMNVDKIKYSNNVVADKLVVFHALNREGVKGTPIIREAMDRLQRAYPDEVECIIDGKMPLDIYLRFLKRVNVVIDQAYSVSVGVNGVYSLAMGKVVLGGGEPEFLKEYALERSPLVPIQPTVEDIYDKLEGMVKRKSDILHLGRESRLFVEKLYDYKKVAKKYIKVWSEF